jgi:uncharacterized membrane protein YfcA
MPITDPWFYALATPAVLLAGVSKGGFGGGLGIVAVPLMALVIAPAQAAALMLPMLCMMDVFGLWAYRDSWDRRNIAIMIPGSILGLGLGMGTFRYLDEDMVRLLVGCIALGFVASHGWRRRAAARPTTASIAVGGWWSAIAGFVSFIAHAGGPPVQIYLLPQRLDKTLFVGTTVIFYSFVNYAKIVPYGMLGLFSAEILWTALVLAPLTPVGMWLGVRLHHVVPEHLFFRLCYAMLAVTGAKLIWDGLGAG